MMMAMKIRVERLAGKPIINAASHPSIGENIQGPSLIRVPPWVGDRLGDYYLYFADHKGSYIRLAYADDLRGPWTVHPPGSLQLKDSHFPTEAPAVPEGALEHIRARAKQKGIDLDKLPHDLALELTAPHIASPDVHVDHENRRIVMYFHGLEGFATQVSRASVSNDGIAFAAQPEILGRTYMRTFRHHGLTYALAMPGQLYRSIDAVGGFVEGPRLFNADMRHCAVLLRDGVLYVFWTQVGHAPERILLSTIDVSGDWQQWSHSEAIEVLRPEYDWEGADAPIAPSVRSVAYGHVNQLRDPAVFVENGRVFLLYAVAGESGIAVAELFFDGVVG
jgi:hypothetical protein